MSRSTPLKGAAIATLVLVAATGLATSTSAQAEVVAFDVATIGIETGSLDPDGSRSDSTDVEIQWFADYTDVVSWDIADSDGQPVFGGALSGAAADQTASELTFASRPSHPYAPEEYPGETLDSFLARYPAGEYTFTGTTDDGTIVTSTATLTHDIPAHPDVRVRVDHDDVKVAWRPVNDCFDDVDCDEVEIVEYAVKFSEEDVTREYFADGAFTNGDSRYTEMHVLPDQICRRRMCRIEMDGEFFVPGNTYEVQVFALEASGNSTYRSVALDVPARRR